LDCYRKTTYCCRYKDTWLDLFHLLFHFYFFIQIGTWLKQRQQGQKQKDEDGEEQLAKE
jgi:hypothetical protein